MNRASKTFPSLALTVCLSAAALAAAPALAQSTLPTTPATGSALPDLPAASAPSLAASGTPIRSSNQRPRSAAETGISATAPGDIKPERSVSPQISIPFGKKAPPPSPLEESAVRRQGAAAATGVDDAIARCDSQTDARARADCRAKVAHEDRMRLPN